jgi:hypothetical protein
MSMTLPHAGGLGSTVGDLLTWEQALRSGRVVSPQSYAAMIEPARLNDGSLSEYGFGLIRLDFRDRIALTHLGGINGFAAMMTRFEEDDLTVVVLSNLDTYPVERALLALARRALGLPDPVARPRMSVAADDLARCAGTYQPLTVPWLPPWLFAVDDGLLTAPFPVPHSRYEPFDRTQFQCIDDPEITLCFDQPGPTGYERVTIEGPMRWPWHIARGKRITAP